MLSDITNVIVRWYEEFKRLSLLNPKQRCKLASKIYFCFV